MRMLFQMSYNVLASVALFCIIILHSNSEPISTFSITVMSEQVSKKRNWEAYGQSHPGDLSLCLQIAIIQF